MSSKLKIQNALAGASQFLQNKVSALQLRKDLEDRAVEEALNQREGQIFEAVVLSDSQQTENITTDDDSETPTFFAAATLRIKGIHDEILPDPLPFVKDEIETASKIISIHPTVFSEEKITGKGLRAGSIVSVRLVNGVFRFAETGGNDNRYNFSIFRGESGRLESLFNGGQALIGQSGEVSWRTKDNIQVNQAAVNFLNRFVEELNKYDPPPITDVVVTSARRTPLQQAKVVLKNVTKAKSKGKEWWPYGSSLWDPIKVIALGSDTEDDKIKKITDYIQKMIDEKGRYMSDHLKAGALDIRTKSIVGPNVANRMAQFKQAAQATGLAKSLAIEFYEEDASTKAYRDSGGTPAKYEHLHLTVLSDNTGE